MDQSIKLRIKKAHQLGKQKTKLRCFVGVYLSLYYRAVTEQRVK